MRSPKVRPDVCPVRFEKESFRRATDGSFVRLRGGLRRKRGTPGLRRPAQRSRLLLGRIWHGSGSWGARRGDTTKALLHTRRDFCEGSTFRRAGHTMRVSTASHCSCAAPRELTDQAGAHNLSFFATPTTRITAIHRTKLFGHTTPCGQPVSTASTPLLGLGDHPPRTAVPLDVTRRIMPSAATPLLHAANRQHHRQGEEHPPVDVRAGDRISVRDLALWSCR